MESYRYAHFSRTLYAVFQKAEITQGATKRCAVAGAAGSSLQNSSSNKYKKEQQRQEQHHDAEMEVNERSSSGSSVLKRSRDAVEEEDVASKKTYHAT